jgi:hypothetical protein
MEKGKKIGQAALFLGIAAAGWAHNFLPLPEGGGETVIPAIADSRAAYREIKAPGQIDLFSFKAKAGAEIYIQMTVPTIEPYASLRPVFVLASLDGPFSPGPSIEDGEAAPVSAEALAALAAPSPENAMAIAALAGAGKRFREEFTGTDYLILQTLTVKAPVTGRYRIGVYLPDGATGKYVLATGKKEAFSLSEIFGLGKVKRLVRDFMEADSKR